MKIKKHFTLGTLVALAGTMLAGASLSYGQSYPNRPLRIIVPYAAGGAADAIARPLIAELGASLGQPVLMENRAGANTIIGAESVVRSDPDGYTLLLAASSTLALNTAAFKDLPYNALRDFAHVAKIVTNNHIWVARRGLDANNIGELLTLAKKKPSSVSYTMWARGSCRK